MAQSKKKRKKKPSPPKKVALKKKHLLFAIGAMLVVVFASFFPVLNAGFSSLDDDKLIQEKVVEMSEQPDKVWRKSFSTPHFKPLVYGSWVLEYRVFGMQPFTYHLINLLYHLLNCVLVFFLALKLTKWFSWTKRKQLPVAIIVAFLFGLHPMHVESVAWAIERKDVMYSFFALLSLLAYTKHLDKKSWLWIGISAISFLVSGLCKAQSIAVPILLFTLDYAYQRKWQLNIAIEKIPHTLVLVILLGLYGFFSADGSEAELAEYVSNKQVSYLEPLASLPGMYVKIALFGLKGVLFYLHTWLPVGLSIGYPYKSWIPALGHGIHVFPVLFALGLYLLYRVRDTHRLVFFAHAFFLAALFPALVRTGLGKSIFLSDRYIYLACFGFVFLLTGLIQNFIQKRKLKGKWQYGVFGVIILLYAIMAFQTSSLWVSQEKLWTNVIKKYPSIAFAHLNRAIYYLDDEKNDEKAFEDLTNAIEQEPLINALTRRGHIFRRRGQHQDAMNDFNRALEQEPDNPHALNGKANVFFDQKRHQDAMALYDQVLANDPDYTEFYVNKAAALYHLKQYEAGLEQLRIAASIDPDYYGIFDKQVVIYIAQGKYDQALEAGRRLSQMQPENHDNHFKMGYALQRQGKHQQAVEALSRAIQISPGTRKYYGYRATSYEALGQHQAAQQDRAKAG